MTITSDGECYKILVPIDCILETHLGTAALLNPKSPIEILNNGYFQRDSNDLWELTDKFSKEEFLEKWEYRGIETLKNSVMRIIIKYIKNMIHCHILDFSDRGGDLMVEVIINGNPYFINNELEEYMSIFIKGYMSTFIDVTFVNLDLTKLTPQYINSNKINVMFLNDFNDWLPLHHLELDKNKCPSLSMYVPAISKHIKQRVLEAIEEGIVDKKIAKEINPFRANEIVFMEYLSLNYLPVEIFSIPKFKYLALDCLCLYNLHPPHVYKWELPHLQH